MIQIIKKEEFLIIKTNTSSINIYKAHFHSSTSPQLSTSSQLHMPAEDVLPACPARKTMFITLYLSALDRTQIIDSTKPSYSFFCVSTYHNSNLEREIEKHAQEGKKIKAKSRICLSLLCLHIAFHPVPYIKPCSIQLCAVPIFFRISSLLVPLLFSPP
jgi:hypothetical protein